MKISINIKIIKNTLIIENGRKPRVDDTSRDLNKIYTLKRR